MNKHFSPVSSKTQSVLLHLVWVATALGIVGPTLALLLSDVSLVAVTNESLSYRFFYSLRLLNGDGGGIVLPQGHILTVFHHLLHLTAMPMAERVGVSILSRLDLFGYLTMGATALIGLALVAKIARAPFLPWHLKLLVLCAVANFAVGSRSGISAFATPDYYSLEALFTGFVMYESARFLLVPKLPNPLRPSVLIGGFFAVALSIKITLLVTAFFPAFALIVRLWDEPRLLMRCLMRALLVCSIVSLAIFTLFYAFDPASAVESMLRWRRFVGNPGGESDFWFNFLFAWSEKSAPSTGYGYALVILPISAYIIASTLYRYWFRMARPQRFMLIAMLATSLVNAYFLIHRPAGTTLWEASLHCVAAAVTALVLVFPLVERTKLHTTSYAGILACVTLVSATINFDKVINLENFTASSQIIREITEVTSSYSNLLMIIPSNDHTAGTLQEGLMKGMSDFPTWEIKSGKLLLSKVFPGLEFAQDDSRLLDYTAVMWVDSVEAPLSQGFPRLADRLTRAPASCRVWRIQTWSWWPRSIYVCAPVPTRTDSGSSETRGPVTRQAERGRS